MDFEIHSLREYPFQPIRDFSEARNWFINRLPEKKYCLFTSDHEELPRMLLDYISRLEPKYPHYRIRLIRLVNGVLEPMWDPIYQPNLCSNRVRFAGRLHEYPVPNKPYGMIDIPMLHNSDGSHGYDEREYPGTRNLTRHLFYRFLRLYKATVYDALGRGLFRKGEERKY